jgi:hypothetical protein
MTGAGAERLGPADEVAVPTLRLVRRGHPREPRSGATLGHGHGVERTTGRVGQHPVPHREVRVGHSERPGHLVGHGRECTGDRAVHVVEESGSTVALGQRHRHLGVLREASTCTAEAGRSHQAHQPGCPQVGEVHDREDSRTVMVRGPLRQHGTKRPRGSQPFGGRRQGRHVATFVPWAWKRPAVTAVGTMRTSARRNKSQRT